MTHVQSPPPRRLSTRVGAWCAVVVAVSALAACGDKEDPMTTDTQQAGGAVCDLVDPALVAQVVGDGEVKTTGDGAVSKQARATGVSSCSITAADAREPIIQVRLGDVTDADASRTTVKGEADEAGLPLTFDDPSFYGYARDYDSGMYNPGTALNVVTDEHVIRVTIYKWSGSTPDQRVDLAEKIARSAAQNQATFDQKS